MRILYFITGLGKGGAETQLINLIKGLSNKKDYEINLISLFGGFYESELKRLNINYDILIKNKFIDFFLLFFRFNFIIKNFKPHIVHSFLFHSNLVTKFFLFFIKKNFKLICSYRCSMEKFFLIKFLEKFNQKRVNVCISNSKKVNSEVKKRFKFIPNSNKVYINNGFIGKGINKDVVKFLKGHYVDKKVILTVAQFRKQKDYKTNVLVCKSLLKLRDDFVFLYLGVGKEFLGIKKMVDKLNLNDHVYFLGQKDNVLDFHSISDVFFMPTLYESQSNSLMEAMFMKVPIVTTDLLENRELVQEGNFCKVGDVGCMVKKINNILNNGYSDEFLESNKRFIEEDLSFNQMVKDYDLIYNKLINGDL